jgi:hypothetical protein
MKALFAGPCHKCFKTIEPDEEVEIIPGGHTHKGCPMDPTVNDMLPWWGWDECWICGDLNDHGGVPHGVATGDGLTRFKIVALMRQGGHTWRRDG